MSELPIAKIAQNLSGRSLARAIFKADAPEEFVKTLPAQSLFMAIKENGLASSTDIVLMATDTQCRLMLDFDCWSKDRFNESTLWDWLALSDDEGGLRILQKILRCVDLKILAFIVSSYVETVTNDEGTDMCPGEGFYSPDRGHTWIRINIEDVDRHRLFAKLLALLYETSSDLYYQLLTAPAIATPSILEEEAYTDKSKRLTSEGIPDAEYAAELNAPMLPQAIRPHTRQKEIVSSSLPGIAPMVYEGDFVQPFRSLLAVVKDWESFESELTLIMNAAIVRWGVDFCNLEEVGLMIQKVKGAINIGLEDTLPQLEGSHERACHEVGLQVLYRVGLSRLISLSQFAKKISKECKTLLENDPVMSAITEALRKPFPEIPSFVLEPSPSSSTLPHENYGSAKDSSIQLDQRSMAIMTINQLELAKDKLAQILETAKEAPPTST